MIILVMMETTTNAIGKFKANIRDKMTRREFICVLLSSFIDHIYFNNNDINTVSDDEFFSQINNILFACKLSYVEKAYFYSVLKIKYALNFIPRCLELFYNTTNLADSDNAKCILECLDAAKHIVVGG